MATAKDNLARKQIYIPATTPEEEIILRVAAYCRVSTDSEDQINSFNAQNTHYNKLITSNDRWELVDIYADEGITGTSAKKRDDFQRMLADCRKGKIDKILVKSISRFARNTMECLETVRELKALGISIFFEEHNIDTKMVSSEMLMAVLASCAQAESESISNNMKWSIHSKMEKGNYVASSVPFGYRRVEGELVIQEEEAQYVKYIFVQYLSGKNTTDIAKELLARSEQEPILRARKWSFQTIVHILKNEKYAGDCLNQKTYMTETLPRRCVRNEGTMAQYYVTNAHTAIIDRASFDAVQKLLTARSKGHVCHTIETSPMGGRFVCGKCGSGFRRKRTSGKYVFACRTHLNDINVCDVRQIQEAEVEAAFMRLYYNLKNHPEILSNMMKSLATVRNRQMLWSPDVIKLNKEISDIISQSHSLTLLKKQGLVDPDIFISMSNQLAEQLRKAKQQKERLQNLGDDNTIDETERILEVLLTGPESLGEFDGELFCELIDKIIVESNTKIRFRLKNGLELPESIERAVR